MEKDKSINNRLKVFRLNRNTEGLSELGKRVIKNCPNAYVNEDGQVIDPCHIYWSEPQDATKW